MMNLLNRRLRRQRKNEKGFTLVELIISMAAGAIILVSAGVLITYSHSNLNKVRARMQLQQDFSFIETLVSQRVRDSIQGRQKVFADYDSYLGGGSAQPNGNCLQLHFPGNDSILIYLSGRDMLIKKSDQESLVLVEGSISGLTFLDLTRSIEMHISAEHMKWNLSDTIRAAFRNFNISN